MGVAKAGFKHEAILERDPHSCQTIRVNQGRGMALVADWRLFEQDVKTFNYRALRGRVKLIAGGPPCQPFSIGGKHNGRRDERNMFPEVVRAVREIAPPAFLFENVKGLTRRSFAPYFGYILLQLEHPEVGRREDETWTEHLHRLERHTKGARYGGLTYRVTHRLLNAANYGVPQRRERVFIIGLRSDLNLNWSFPEPSHSSDALIWDQWITGAYWERHRVSRKARPEPPDRLRGRLEHLRTSLFTPNRAPWRTIRDAISDLPEPRRGIENGRVVNHRLVPGARAYTGHTGSPIDEPSKTLKAGVHGVPGGENMLAFSDGRVRYLTVREAARLQTFPDEYFFPCSWTESMRQLGNAVPVRLAEAMADSVARVLHSTRENPRDGNPARQNRAVGRTAQGTVQCTG